MITICIMTWCNTIYFVDAVEIRAASLRTDCLHSASLFCISSGMTQQLEVGCIMHTSSKHYWLLSACPAGTTTIYAFPHVIGSFQQEDWDSKVNTQESRMDILDFSWHIFVWCYCIDRVNYEVGPGPRKRIETLLRMRASRSIRCGSHTWKSTVSHKEENTKMQLY